MAILTKLKQWLCSVFLFYPTCSELRYVWVHEVLNCCRSVVVQMTWVCMLYILSLLSLLSMVSRTSTCWFVQTTTEEEPLPPWIRGERERKLAAQEGSDLPFPVYLIGSALVAIAAVSRACLSTCPNVYWSLMIRGSLPEGWLHGHTRTESVDLYHANRHLRDFSLSRIMSVSYLCRWDLSLSLPIATPYLEYCPRTTSFGLLSCYFFPSPASLLLVRLRWLDTCVSCNSSDNHILLVSNAHFIPDHLEHLSWPVTSVDAFRQNMTLIPSGYSLHILTEMVGSRKTPRGWCSIACTGFLFFKAITAANKEAERQDKIDGYWFSAARAIKILWRHLYDKSTKFVGKILICIKWHITCCPQAWKSWSPRLGRQSSGWPLPVMHRAYIHLSVGLSVMKERHESCHILQVGCGKQ